MKLTGIPADTSPDAAWVQLEVYRRMSPEQRLLQALRLSDSVRATTAAGIRDRHPKYSEEQIKMLVIHRCLGEELFRKAYPKVRLPE